jgi:hypothetical protein
MIQRTGRAEKRNRREQKGKGLVPGRNGRREKGKETRNWLIFSPFFSSRTLSLGWRDCLHRRIQLYVVCLYSLARTSDQAFS